MPRLPLPLLPPRLLLGVDGGTREANDDDVNSLCCRDCCCCLSTLIDEDEESRSSFTNKRDRRGCCRVRGDNSRCELPPPPPSPPPELSRTSRLGDVVNCRELLLPLLVVRCNDGLSVTSDSPRRCCCCCCLGVVGVRFGVVGDGVVGVVSCCCLLLRLLLDLRNDDD